MSSKESVLIIEDENNILSFLSTVFTAANYHVLKAKDGAEAFMMITSYCPDLILLDLGLPDTDGLKIIKSVRTWSQVPIIVVSARTHEKDKIAALDFGADDYITKPFGTGELLARVRAALRHVRRIQAQDVTVQKGIFVVGEFSIDFDKRRIILQNQDIHLTQNEYKLVALLAKYAGKVLTYDYIIKNLWGPNMKCDNQILRVNMANIRRKIEINPAEPKYIFTEVGVGYRMVEAD